MRNTQHYISSSCVRKFLFFGHINDLPGKILPILQFKQSSADARNFLQRVTWLADDSLLSKISKIFAGKTFIKKMSGAYLINILPRTFLPILLYV